MVLGSSGNGFSESSPVDLVTYKELLLHEPNHLRVIVVVASRVMYTHVIDNIPSQMKLRWSF